MFYAISWDFVKTKYKLNWDFEDNNNRALTGQPVVGFISLSLNEYRNEQGKA